MKKDDELRDLKVAFEAQKKDWEEKFVSVGRVLEDIKKERLKELSIQAKRNE